MLTDLTAELLWPKALRTPALALRPARVMLGMVAVFIAALIGSLSQLWSDERPRFTDAIADPITVTLGSAARAVLNLSVEDLTRAAAALAELRRLPLERPVETVVLGLPILAVFALFGGAISRAVAIEFAAARFSDWPADTAVSVRKLGWSVAAIVAPPAVAGILIGLIALGGFTLGVPVLNIVGALLFAIALVLAGAALILFVVHTLALPMLVPALMCEGTDAFDAVQRAYAYIIAHPLRLLAHAAILLVLGAVSIGLFSGFAAGADALATTAAARLTSDAGVEVLVGDNDLSATQPVAHAIISGWRALLALAVSGFAFSYFFAAGTVLYLIARRICDGQGITEIWDPAADQH
jgi:hypothetical protein